jgi:hypothetical protein
MFTKTISDVSSETAVILKTFTPTTTTLTFVVGSIKTNWIWESQHLMGKIVVTALPLACSLFSSNSKAVQKWVSTFTTLKTTFKISKWYTISPYPHVKTIIILSKIDPTLSSYPRLATAKIITLVCQHPAILSLNRHKSKSSCSVLNDKLHCQTSKLWVKKIANHLKMTISRERNICKKHLKRIIWKECSLCIKIKIWMTLLWVAPSLLYRSKS